MPAAGSCRRCGPLWHPIFARSRKLAYHKYASLARSRESGPPERPSLTRYANPVGCFALRASPSADVHPMPRFLRSGAFLFITIDKMRKREGLFIAMNKPCVASLRQPLAFVVLVPVGGAGTAGQVERLVADGRDGAGSPFGAHLLATGALGPRLAGAHGVGHLGGDGVIARQRHADAQVLPDQKHEQDGHHDKVANHGAGQPREVPEGWARTARIRT